jgi:hypothetical protein
MRKTLRKRKIGGFDGEDQVRIKGFYILSNEKKEQILHCLSQLRRFCDCFMKGDKSRVLQFGYNLGRLQELCGETTKHKIWWKPAEAAFTKGMSTGDWSDLSAHVETIKGALGVEYDDATVKSGC